MGPGDYITIWTSLDAPVECLVILVVSWASKSVGVPDIDTSTRARCSNQAAVAEILLNWRANVVGKLTRRFFRFSLYGA